MLTHTRENERGVALMEMSIVMLVLLTVLFGILEFGRLLWTCNALVEATRIGARYAVTNTQNVAAVRNVVVYGAPEGGANPVIPGLAPANINVVYTNFSTGNGHASISVNYTFAFIVPMFGANIALPTFRTTLSGESAGVIP